VHIRLYIYYKEVRIMARKQRIKVKRGVWDDFGSFTDIYTGERYDTFGLILFLKSGKLSKRKPKIKKK